MELQQLRKNALRLRQNFSQGSMKHFPAGIALVNVVVSSLLDRRRSRGSHYGVVERHSCAGTSARILKKRLAEEIQSQIPERRAHVRGRMRLILKPKGQDEGGRSFEQLPTTENVRAEGFLCNFSVALAKEAICDVFLSAAGQDRFVGRVRPARIESPGTPWQRYGFQFVERSAEWILQDQTT